MSNVWMQSKSGRVMDMIDAHKNVIDFREMADTLAHINRYNGCGEDDQVSVAFHMVMGSLICPPALVPWWILHDGHEYIMGDITTPAALGLEEIANRVFGRIAYGGTAGSVLAGRIVKDAIKELKTTHDIAIHTAAGLPMPTPFQKQQIREIDMRCLNTEKRDFLVKAPKPWESESFGIDTSRDWYDHWREPDQVADALYGLFLQHLPALRKPANDDARRSAAA